MFWVNQNGRRCLVSASQKWRHTSFFLILLQARNKAMNISNWWPDPQENFHLNVKKLSKTCHSKKKIVLFPKQLPLAILKKKQQHNFWEFLYIEMWISEESDVVTHECWGSWRHWWARETCCSWTRQSASRGTPVWGRPWTTQLGTPSNTTGGAAPGGQYRSRSNTGQGQTWGVRLDTKGVRQIRGLFK